DTVLLAPTVVAQGADRGEQFADVLAAPYDLAHAVVSQARIEAMVPQTARRHRIGNFIPFIEVVCDCAKVCGSLSCPCGAEQNDRDECKAGAHRWNLLSVARALARNASPCARMTAVCSLRLVT